MEEAQSSDEIHSEDEMILLMAVSNNSPMDIVTSLISPGTINVRNVMHETALHVAAIKKRWELVPVLLQHGADVNLGDGKTQTPLHLAVYHGAPADIITQLISPHNINMQDKCGQTALHWAVREKRWELVPVLLQHGADVNLYDSTNQVSSHWAALFGAPADIITRLISPHNINMQDDYGLTVLHTVVSGKRWELVPVLLQHGADVNLANCRIQTPLHLAACYGAPANVITRLISPYNINIKDEDHGTALYAAVTEERWELVPVLLQHGADVNVGAYDNDTPLHLAASYGASTDIITQLISPHNINMQDDGGDTVLNLVVKEKSWDLVPVLLQHGADPFICNILPEPPWPLSLQSLCIATIRSHMPVKSDEAFDGLGLLHVLPELKLKPLADEIIAVTQKKDMK